MYLHFIETLILVFLHGFTNLIEILFTDLFYTGLQYIGQQLFAIWLVLFISFIICNVIYLKKIIKNDKLEKARIYSLIIKFSLIPFWIINFSISVYMIFSIPFVVGLIFLPMQIIQSFLFLSVGCYIILLVTSSYSISYLILMKKNNIINKRLFIIFIITQL